MKLIYAEMKKAFASRTLCVLLLVLLLFNFALIVYISRPEPYEKAVRDSYSLYIENSVEITEYYEELKLLAIINAREEYSSLPYTYDKAAKYDDLAILNKVFERVNYLSGRRVEIEKIIRGAERKLEDLYDYGYDDKTYAVRSQKALVEAYQKLLEQQSFEDEYAYGYEIYFENGSVSIFILFFITAAVAFVFLNDSGTGFSSILRVSKRGRLSTAAAKLAVTFVLCLGGALLFLSTTFIAVGLTNGFSSPYSAVQLLPGFSTVPYTCSIFEYLLIHSTLRLFAFTVYALFIATISSLKLPYIFSFGMGALLSVANLFVLTRKYNGTPPNIKHLNFAAMTQGASATSFYRTVSLFGQPLTHVAVLLFSSLISCVLFAVLSAVFFCGDIRPFRSLGLSLRTFRVKFMSGHRKAGEKIKKNHHLNLGLYELKKSRATLSFLMIFVILFSGYCYTRQMIGDMESYEEALYYGYISEIQTLNITERKTYMTAERARIDNIINDFSKNKAAFELQEITREDYSKYLNLYYETAAKNIVFERIENYVLYIDRKNDVPGVESGVIYTSGYEKHFGRPSDIFLYAALTVLCLKTFSVEYASGKSGFSEILRTTKKGRNRTFKAKFLTYTMFGILISLAFGVVKLLAARNGYLMSDNNAPLYSVEAFSSVTASITINQYLILEFLIQIFAGTVISVILCSLSCFCKKILATLSVSILVLGMPEILTRTVLSGFSDFSAISLTSPRDLFFRSAEARWFNMDLGYLIVVCLLWAVLLYILVFIARQKYNGNKLQNCRRAFQK